MLCWVQGFVVLLYSENIMSNTGFCKIYITQLFLVSTEELLAGVDDTELSKSYCTMIGLTSLYFVNVRTTWATDEQYNGDVMPYGWHLQA